MDWKHLSEHKKINMKTKSILFCLVLLCVSCSCIAQKNDQFRRFIFETGLNRQTTLDQRFTANGQTDLGFQLNTRFEFGNKNKLNRLELNFSKNFVEPDFTYFTNLNPELRYTHLRSSKWKNLKIGGYADIGSLIIFPQGAWKSPLSYTLWSSLGIAAKWQKPVSIGRKKLQLSIEGSLPLLSYVIRPAYAQPYADNYLVDGTFDFDREGMGKYLLKSGQLKTLNQFNNFKAKTTLTMPFGKKGHQIGLSYDWSLLWKGGNQKLWFAQQQLSLNVKFNLHAK